MCPRPDSTGEAAQRTLTARLCTDLSFFYMYITADAFVTVKLVIRLFMRTLCPELVMSLIYIINSGHNVHMKKPITSFTVTKVSEVREQIHIFSNSVSRGGGEERERERARETHMHSQTHGH